MAEAMGTTGATLMHHLNALEARGLAPRWREPDNRRVERTALAPAGEQLFARLREVAMCHLERLRSHLNDAGSETLQLPTAPHYYPQPVLFPQLEHV
jgi:MarR family transcriptional regulator for hemolysin